MFTENLIEDVATGQGQDGDKVLQIMFKAYQKIGASDAAHGLGRLMYDNPQTRIEHLQLEGKINLATSLCDTHRLASGKFKLS